MESVISNNWKKFVLLMKVWNIYHKTNNQGITWA